MEVKRIKILWHCKTCNSNGSIMIWNTDTVGAMLRLITLNHGKTGGIWCSGAPELGKYTPPACAG